jgi:hypothetical protein
MIASIIRPFATLGQAWTSCPRWFLSNYNILLCLQPIRTCSSLIQPFNIPKGIVKNLLVRVKNSFVLANFVVLDMDGDLGCTTYPWTTLPKGRQGEERCWDRRNPFPHWSRQHTLKIPKYGRTKLRDSSWSRWKWNLGRTTPPTWGPTDHTSKKKENEEGVVEGVGHVVDSHPEKNPAYQTLNDEPLLKLNR